MKLACFKRLVLFSFIWQITRLFVAKPESNKWGFPSGLMECGWNNLLEPKIGGNSTTETKNPLNIVLWTHYRGNKKLRLERLRSIVQTMSKNICFEDCRLSLSMNQSDADSADAIAFVMFREGFKVRNLPVRTNWNQIWVYIQDEPPIHYRPKAYLNGIFNWTMTYRTDSDIYQPYYRLLPLAESLKRTDPLKFGNRTYNSEEWVNGKTKLAIAVISNCRAVSKRLTVLRNLKSSGIPVDVFGGCGNKSIPVPGRYQEGADDAFWREVGRKYRFYFAMENSICSDYVTEKFWHPMEHGMVPIVMGRARYLNFAPPHSYIDMRDFPEPNDLKKYLQFLANDSKAYSEFFEWRRHYNVVPSKWDLCELCAKLKQHKRRVQQDSPIYGSSPKFNDHYEHTVHMNLAGWWNSVPRQPNLPVCIHPKEFGLKNYLRRRTRLDFDRTRKPLTKRSFKKSVHKSISSRSRSRSRSLRKYERYRYRW